MNPRTCWGPCLLVLSLGAACNGQPPSALPAPSASQTEPPSPSPTSLPPTLLASLPSFPLTPTRTPLPTTTSTPSPTLIPSPSVRVYVFPVTPLRDVAFSEGGHLYPATDIFAPPGAQFVAVTSGVVDFVSTQDTWNPVTDDPSTRGGLSVSLIGDDGVRYYGAHLAAIVPGIKPGVRVKPGQLLGYVGNSGDAAGRPTHLHFGISPPTFPDDWHSRRGLVDPYPYLVAWKAGAAVTPVLANIDLTQAP